MKKLSALLFILFSCTQLFSQTDSLVFTNWKYKGQVGLDFNQAGFYNWAAGGNSSVAFTGLFNYSANYKIDTTLYWENSIDLGLGYVFFHDLDTLNMRKTEDKIDLNSKFGYNVFTDNVYAASLVNFKTQFMDGFNYPNSTTEEYVSGAFSPAFLIVSIGMDYKPSDRFSVYVSPLTGRFIWVTDTVLANRGLHGNYVNEVIENGVTRKVGETFTKQLGGMARVSYKNEILENVNYDGRIEFFVNYTPQFSRSVFNYVRVNSENTFNMKINSWLSANVFVHFIYDHDVLIPIFEEVNGVEVETGRGRRLQVKEIIGLGISYKL